MHGVEKGLTEFGGMLKIAECDIKKWGAHIHVMAVQNKPSSKKKVKTKDMISKPKPQPKHKLAL
jgi:hypothetical protein